MEKRYLNTWVFNIYRIMDTLANIVMDHGGDVKSEPWKYTIIHRDDKSIVENTSHSTYLRFRTKNHVIYIQYDENPFFPPMYTKAPIHNDKYSLDHCLEDIEDMNNKISVSIDNMYTEIFDENKIAAVAKAMYEYLITLPSTPVKYYQDKKRFDKWTDYRTEQRKDVEN